MNKDEALKLLAVAAKAYRGTFDDHMQLQQALAVLGQLPEIEVNPPTTKVNKPKTKKKE